MYRDWAFSRYLAIEHGIGTIPMSAFYSTPETKSLAANYTRFCFAKTDTVLLEADKRLKLFATKAQRNIAA